MGLRTFTLLELAEKSGGTLDGESLTLSGLAGVDEAGDRDFTFVRTAAQEGELRSSKALAAAVPLDFPKADRPVIRHPNPRFVFCVALSLAAPPETHPPGIDPRAAVDPNARVSPEASIGPFAVIEAEAEIGPRTRIGPHVVIGKGARIGADCRLDPGVVVYRDCVVGDRATLFSGAVIGCDGFGFEVWKNAVHRMNHVGNTVIGNDVEIGAQTCVDRATTGSTSVGHGSKLDNLVQIGHNVQIGRSTLIAAMAGIAGSCKIGNGVVMGGRVMMPDHAEVGDGARLAGNTGVWKKVPPGVTWSGNPARDHRTEMRELVALPRLPQLLRDFEALRREVLELKGDLAALRGGAGPEA